MKMLINDTSDQSLYLLAERLDGVYRKENTSTPATYFNDASNQTYKIISVPLKLRDGIELINIAVHEDGTWNAGHISYDGKWMSEARHSDAEIKGENAEMKLNAMILNMTLEAAKCGLEAVTNGNYTTFKTKREI